MHVAQRPAVCGFALCLAVLGACRKSDRSGSGGEGGQASEGGRGGGGAPTGEGGTPGGPGGRGGEGGMNMVGMTGGAGGMAGTAGMAMTGGQGMAGGGGSGPTVDTEQIVYVAGSGTTNSIERYRLNVATGALTSLGKTNAENPMYLDSLRNGRMLYAALEASSVQAFAIAPTGALTAKTKQPSKGNLGVHTSVHPSGRWLFVSNYIGGNVSVFPIGPNGDIGAAADTKPSGEESHQIMPDLTGKFVFVPCRGPNHVAQFQFDAQTGVLTPNEPKTVASDDPRHIAFHPSGKWAYLLNEDPATVVTFAYDAAKGRLTEAQKINLMAGENWGSHIVVSPDGKFVFAAGRRTNRMFVFKVDAATGHLTAVGNSSAGNSLKQPRGYALTADGRFLIVANEGDASVVVMEVSSDGGLSKVGSTIPSVSGALSVVVVPVPKP